METIETMIMATSRNGTRIGDRNLEEHLEDQEEKI